ncbi:MAG: bifunctional folylpolyglutamate synthase/dihydrofolate synthase [Epsilonproteobacteria bacterium]|nr:bifunctional folylpolyglutamate synthase/dihydrofolate synthase [Campylobacterota bacterium]
MPRVYEKLKSYLPKPKIIHLIGTNGKGTTGRFLATALYNLGFNVGHYTSPHILKFNERIWLNAKDVSDKILEEAHKKLYSILDKVDAEALSYFEYTTFLSMIVYENCEFVVMEAGLGGEHDATAVFDKILTLVTPISYDHEAFLGTSLKEIATTKLNAIQKDAILAKQDAVVYEVAESLDAVVYMYDEMLDAEDTLKIKNITKELSLQEYLVENLKLSISALKFLGIPYEVKSFKNSKLFGRCSAFGKNIIVDVGHNPLASTALLNSLYPSKYVLIYNTYKDKEYKKILNILKPIIKRVEIIEITNERIQEISKLQSVLKDLEIEYTIHKDITADENYLVFGSFSVVEAFMKRQKI